MSPPSRPNSPFRPRRTRAFTLVEVSVAMLILAMFLGALFEASRQVLGLLTAQKETIASAQAFQERMESVRALSFSQITDPTYLHDQFFAAPTASAVGLPDPLETLTVSAFPPNATPSTRLHRAPDGVVTQDSVNLALSKSSAVRVDFQFDWMGRGSRPRQRAYSTVVAKGGIGP